MECLVEGILRNPGSRLMEMSLQKSNWYCFSQHSATDWILLWPGCKHGWKKIQITKYMLLQEVSL